ncbi:hypothetical protein JOC77_000784 [Peribacillus deserti]|uniref:Uncharacterized protein n=1 Tax=Peribacillus deserti TaxID=673318 RepID=A0ABS2QEY0_9BACI|nr:hypothetical protein [Peribacillus deserti]MBM7691379.1 hypothetical protein [Peribacillus deserti]
MLRWLPAGFWLSLVCFVFMQWTAVPVIAYFTDRPAHVMLGAMIIILVIYPAYFVCSLLYLYNVKKIKQEELIVTAYFLIIPLFLYFPIFHLL